MKKILFFASIALLTASCTEDYTDWADLQRNAAEDAKTVSASISPATGNVDLASEGDSVRLFTPTVVAVDETTATYTVEMAGTEDGTDTFTLTADNDGRVLKSDLQDVVVALYGARPVARTLNLNVTGYILVNGQSIRNKLGATTLSVIPEAPEVEQVYYLTGSINGWDNTDTTYKLTNDGSDPYENQTFTLRIPAPEDGSNVEFKFTPESGLGGDWSKCLGSGDEGKFLYNNGGGNFVITAVEGAKYYDITVNMLDQTWSYAAVNFNPFIYFIGATDGWSASDQKLAHQGDGVYTGYCYVADPNGWGLAFKFQRVAGSWDDEINAGTFTTKTGVTGDNNIEVAEAGVYYFTVDLANASITAMKVTNMNLVGDFNGWNAADDAQQMTWDADNYCYVITSAGVTASGWKFTTNNSWDVNLGGDTTADLTANGANISAVGTTIKLYPTRKTSDNIYCTVE